jgi:hypothetical protein
MHINDNQRAQETAHRYRSMILLNRQVICFRMRTPIDGRFLDEIEHIVLDGISKKRKDEQE